MAKGLIRHLILGVSYNVELLLLSALDQEILFSALLMQE